MTKNPKALWALLEDKPRAEAWCEGTTPNEKRLRRLLAIRVGLTYGDDGELQSSEPWPPIDFKRDTVDAIEEKIGQRGLAALRSTAELTARAFHNSLLGPKEAAPEGVALDKPPLKLHFDEEWLRRTIAADPDNAEQEAGGEPTWLDQHAALCDEIRRLQREVAFNAPPITRKESAEDWAAVGRSEGHEGVARVQPEPPPSIGVCTQEYCQRFGLERERACGECCIDCFMCLGKGATVSGHPTRPVVKTCNHCHGTARLLSKSPPATGGSK